MSTTSAPAERAARLREAELLASVSELVEALREIEMYYPHGINPDMDRLVSHARALIAKHGA